MKDQPAVPSNPGAINEAIEGRPWWKVCLASCAILLVAGIAASFFLVRTFVGSTPKRISSLPDGFPSDLVLFRPEDAREIYYYPGKAKGKVFRFMTAPVKFIASLVGKQEELPDFASENPIDNADTVSILWTDIDASKDEVLRFYAGSLQQLGVANPEMQKFDDRRTIEMVGSTETTTFSMVLIDDSETEAIDTVTIIVEYPSPSETSETSE